MAVLLQATGSVLELATAAWGGVAMSLLFVAVSEGVLVADEGGEEATA